MAPPLATLMAIFLATVVLAAARLPAFEEAIPPTSSDGVTVPPFLTDKAPNSLRHADPPKSANAPESPVGGLHMPSISLPDIAKYFGRNTDTSSSGVTLGDVKDFLDGIKDKLPPVSASGAGFLGVTLGDMGLKTDGAEGPMPSGDDVSGDRKGDPSGAFALKASSTSVLVAVAFLVPGYFIL